MILKSYALHFLSVETFSKVTFTIFKTFNALGQYFPPFLENFRDKRQNFVRTVTSYFYILLTYFWAPVAKGPLAEVSSESLTGINLLRALLV
jgi:hypothetical protein